LAEDLLVLQKLRFSVEKPKKKSVISVEKRDFGGKSEKTSKIQENYDFEFVAMRGLAPECGRSGRVRRK
jgi:hypothetical protein